MRTRTVSPLGRLACAAIAVIAVSARAETVQAPVAPAAAVPNAGTWSTSELEVRYEVQPPLDGQQGRAVLQGEVDAGASRLRARVRIDPGAQQQPASGVDLSWALPAPGLLSGLVVGDGYTSGAGWSPPARMTGLRFGRAQSLRAPLRADPAPFVAPAAFAAAGQPAVSHPTVSQGWRSAASGLLPVAGGPIAPTPGDAHPLEAGATDYEVELGRLREGWDSTDRRYLGQYAAAAYRAGVGLGLTAEARTEWSATGSAHGVELLKDLGGGAMLQALAAQSAAPDATGGRWGAGVVLPGDLWRWKLTYAAADREFRSATAGAEARRGVRLESSLQWRGGALDASVSRNELWDAAAPESILALGSRFDLARHVQLRMDLARRVSLDPGWRAGVSLSVPVE